MLTTVGAILANVPRGMPVNEVRLLLGAVLKQPAVWLLTHGDAALSIEQCLKLNALVDRRVNGEPMAYLLGYREFYGREFVVSPSELIPRPETEMLVDLVKVSVGADEQCRLSTADPLRRRKAMLCETPASPPLILDLGTGSGCIAISVALECASACVTTVDASTDALNIAINNAKQLNADVEFIRSDWFAALEDRRFDIIVSNPPYIAIGDTHLDHGDLRFEPAQALSSGHDGLAALRKIIGEAPHHLHPNGMLALEHGYDQAPAVSELLGLAGFTGIRQLVDIAGITRVSCGYLTGSAQDPTARVK